MKGSQVGKVGMMKERVVLENNMWQCLGGVISI